MLSLPASQFHAKITAKATRKHAQICSGPLYQYFEMPIIKLGLEKEEKSERLGEEVEITT
jgi:hypothetical protein